MIRIENVLKTSLQDVSKTSWRYLEDNFARHLEGPLAKRLEDVLKTFWQDILETSWRRLGKTVWRRLEDVFNRYGQDQCLDQDFFWRRNSKGGIFVLTKVSWKRLHKTNVCWVVTTLKHFFLVMSPAAGAYSGVYSTISREPFNIIS